ncbi:GNAT family N-acetyltransferase [Micromonosporaceae bacterium DT55]|uniref:GNAT family N-acetyltransferase n=1 Tax=Melissospora conviva TaxID=3388432 RepID=UPI003C140D3C
MSLRSVHDRDELAALLRRDPALHAYELGDLDDEFWPQTTWYRHGDAVALLYHGTSLPTLIALDPPDRQAELTALIAAAVPLLPARFHAHLSTGAETGLAAGYDLHQVSGHLKMSLTDPGLLPPEPADGDALGEADLPELLKFYDAAYPQHWFEPGMLAKGPYLGIRRDGELVAVCGTHVWSPAYGVAAIGNVAVRPDVRGQGLGRTVVGQWCRLAAARVERIGLNVRADNVAAVALYRRLGFSVVGEYVELLATSRPAPATRP